MAAADTTMVVLDTNVFLHFQPIEQWDWSSLLTLPVRIVICAQVLRELDDQKDKGGSRSKRDRARKSLMLAERAAEAPVLLRDGVSIVVEPFSPGPETFTGGLSQENPDDRIVAAALALRADDVSVVFVSNDTTPRLRAKVLGLQVLVPPDTYRLPEEDDPRDAEIKRLTARLQAIERAIPKPVLCFDNGNGSIAVVAPDPEFIGVEPEDPAAVLAGVLPMQVHAQGQGEPHQDSDAEPGAAAADFVRVEMARLMQPTPDQVEKYNREVQAFRRDYPAAYEQRRLYRDEMASLLVFRLVLENEGTAPVEHPEVILRIAAKHSDRFEIVIPDALPLPPKLPAPPIRPSRLTAGIAAMLRHPMDRWLGEDGPPGLDGTSSPAGWLLGASAASGPRYVDYESDHIRFGHSKLKHGFTLEYGPFAIRRLDPPARGCSLEYEIHADNLPEAIVGVLHVRFAS